ncbi:MAG TPA: rhodanese-like domain-containing protein [Bdellovibrio sp.]|uniref:rhodanese-like domain-containing protein n=1 Tax=Bdellovibrio sp. TaxID=28201 RepID=UPI002EE2FC0B
MRIRSVSIVLILVSVVGAAGIFYYKRSILLHKTSCDFVKAKVVFLNDAHLGSLMSQTAHAVLIPEGEARCLPNSYKGFVEFYSFRAPLFIPFSFTHRLDLTLQKDRELQSLKYFLSDSENLKVLGYKNAQDAVSDLKRIYGAEVDREKFAWIGVSANAINWVRDVSGVPIIHPIAKVIDKAQLQDLLKTSKIQIVDLREANETEESSIPGSLRFKDLPARLHMRAEEPKDLKIFESLSAHVSKDLPVVLYTNNETDYAAYNTATALRVLGYQSVSIYRGGLDEWKNKRIIVPTQSPVRVVSAYDLLQLSRTQKLLFIDVRSLYAFNFYHIKDARRVTVGDYLNNKAILSLLNVFPGTTPVIVGQSEYDWRPYKVLTSILRSKPSLAKNILWYRQGLSDAEFFNTQRKDLADSERLPMEGTKTSASLNDRDTDDTPRKPRKVGDFESQEDQ